MQYRTVFRAYKDVEPARAGPGDLNDRWGWRGLGARRGRAAAQHGWRGGHCTAGVLDERDRTAGAGGSACGEEEKEEKDKGGALPSASPAFSRPRHLRDRTPWALFRTSRHTSLPLRCLPSCQPSLLLSHRPLRAPPSCAPPPLLRRA